MYKLARSGRLAASLKQAAPSTQKRFLNIHEYRSAQLLESVGKPSTRTRGYNG